MNTIKVRNTNLKAGQKVLIKNKIMTIDSIMEHEKMITLRFEESLSTGAFSLRNKKGKTFDLIVESKTKQSNVTSEYIKTRNANHVLKSMAAMRR